MLLIRSLPVLAMSFLVQWGDFISRLECIDHEIPELAHIHTLHTIRTYCISSIIQ